MKTQFKFILPAVLLSYFASLANGDVILFDDAYQNGLSAYGGGTSIVSSPSPVYSGTSSMEWNAGNWSMTGVRNLGTYDVYPIIELYRYRTSGAINEFALRLGGSYLEFQIKSDGSHDAYISFDDVPGYNSTPDQWFKVQINIGKMIDDNVITSTPVQAIQSWKSGGTDIWYVDDMRKVVAAAVPESSSILLFALGILGCITGIYRRRK